MGMVGAAALRIISRISLECDRTGNPLCLGNILVLTGRPLFSNRRIVGYSETDLLQAEVTLLIPGLVVRASGSWRVIR